jgi:multisubunit Na+/H+ antiporter MnhC subunit
MESRLAANLPAAPGGASTSEGGFGKLPPQLQQGFSDSMAQALMLPAAVVLIGLVAVLFFARPTHLDTPAAQTEKTVQAG